MPDAVSALGGASYDGLAAIREIGPLGMITLRAAQDLPGLAEAVLAATGLALPEVRRINGGWRLAAGWMSPDEVLLILPHAQLETALATLQHHLAGQHHLASDVSDARAVFRIEGPHAAEVIMKLCPVDVAALAPAELRRTRAAQVACAFWAEDGGFTLVCFRSVAGYVMALLSHSARPGSGLGLV